MRSRIAAVSSITLGLLPVLSANGSAIARSRRVGAESLALVGYVHPSLPELQGALRLTGAWSAKRGWIRARFDSESAIPEEWKATAWQLFVRPNGPPVTLRTRPLPESTESGIFYSVLRPLGGGVAVARSPRPRPRVARPERGDRTELRTSTRQLLLRHGIRPPRRPRIYEAWRVDLDGDGRDEVLWTARSRDAWQVPYSDMPGQPVAGDYALLGLRYVSGRTVRSAVLSLTRGQRQAETDRTRTIEHNVAWYRLFSPLDIDGDGKMEILAHVRYFEEDELLAFAFDGQQVTSILGTDPPRTGSTRGGP